ncbi:MAG TPA: TIR domain-containing protein [Pyrinomonadaceae bacterium]
MLTGLGLLAFGLALHFALNYYYSSSYSQVSDSKTISGSRFNKTNSLKLRFKKPEAAAGELTQPGDFEQISYDVSANPAETTPASASESSYPKASKTSTASPNSAQASQIQLEITLGTSVVRTQCPSGSRTYETNCGNTRVTVTTRGGRPPYTYRVSGGRILGQGQSQTTWDLSSAQPGNYLITVVSGNAITRKAIRVESCKCVAPTPLPTQKPTQKPTPIQTQTPPASPTPKPSVTPVQTPTREASPTPVIITPTPTVSPTKTGTANTVTPTNGTPGNIITHNSNAIGSNGDADKIGYTYPSRFIKDTEYTVCLSLQPERSEINLCENKDSNTPVVTGAARVEPVTKPGYDAFVTAELLAGDGLQVVAKPEEMRLPYDRQAGTFPQWKWKLKLSDAGENSEMVEIQFNCDVEWISKENSAVSEKQAKYWTSDALESRVGLPLSSKIFTYLSTITGGLAFIFSVVPVWSGKKEPIRKAERVFPPISGQISEDEVHCTLYAPPEARAGESFVIQIFAHLIEQAEGLEEMAKALDEAARKHVAEKLKRKIKRGSTLAFKLTMPGLEASETEESAAWEGEPLEIQFIVSVPDNHLSGKRFGKVSVYENNEKIGTITFRIEILAREERQASAPPSEAALTPVPMSRKESAFVSYASEDKAEVYNFLRLLDTVGVMYHVDIVNIAPGDRWEQKLYEFIDADDVFLLFWSKAASRSEWVIKEAERAHLKTGSERKNPPKIVIFHLESPPEAEIPEWLRDIHYDRKWTQLSENARRQN